MPMSPRLLRPLTGGVHPDAAAWRSAVVANGGSVSASTMRAVSKFCADIDAAGIRGRFYRLNLFCGNGLTAALVPLYRAQSRTATALGNTTDTNSGPFVSGDYTETGSGGGLLGNGTSKYLETGFAPNTLTSGDTHLSAYATAANSVASFPAAIGSFSATNGSEFSLHFCQSTLTTAAYYTESNTGPGFTPSAVNNPTGHLLGTAVSTSDRRFFLNGTQSGTTVTDTNTVGLDSRTLFVFRRNNAPVGGPSYTSARLAAYSIGAGLTVSQAASFYTAMQAFQTALSRNV
jgi:hypothetical protein